MAYNPMAAYSTNKVTTATPAELTLMLYEGAIKFCNIAKVAMERNDMQNANLNIQKARNIIVELQTTLNFDYPVAKDFDAIYTFIFDRMVEANVSKNPDVVEEILVQLRELRDIWKQVMKVARDPRAQ
ncbi:MAG: flagellar export chaperone FliS [Lachnospiraceae bacterium]|nr:flagellar export chaperone FliS [Lachnospiraceae bacterium]MDE6625151.1 flagellar export chaperone FliS [Lachnospiraceae bacterium]